MTTRHTLPKNSIIPVVGVTFEKENVSQVTVGDEVALMPEPDNPYDRHAVGVYVKNIGKVGYLPKKLAERLTSFKDTNATHEAHSWEAKVVECIKRKTENSNTDHISYEQVGLRIKIISS